MEQTYYHVYLVALSNNNVLACNLPVELRKNISRSVTFQAPQSVEIYVQEGIEDIWIVVYEESNFGGCDLNLELSQFGYKVIECLDNIGGIAYIEDNKPEGIDRLIGYLAFQEICIGKEVIDTFKTEFNPCVFKKMLDQNIAIDDYLLEIESNAGYLFNYLVTIVMKEGFLTDNQRRILDTRIEIDNLDMGDIIEHIYSIQGIEDHGFILDVIFPQD